jgi:hypothetical protein
MKGRFLRGVPGIALGFVLLFASCAGLPRVDTSASTEPAPSIRIINNTGYTIFYVYVSRSDSDSWGRDLLGNEVLSSGDSFLCRLPFSLDVVNRYDIQLEDNEGDTYTKMNVLIGPNARIAFTIRDLD